MRNIEELEVRAMNRGARMVKCGRSRVLRLNNVHGPVIADTYTLLSTRIFLDVISARDKSTAATTPSQAQTAAGAADKKPTEVPVPTTTIGTIQQFPRAPLPRQHLILSQSTAPAEGQSESATRMQTTCSTFDLRI